MNNKTQVETAGGARPREEMVLLGFLRGFLIWFVVYMVLQGQDGFFAVTVDRVQSVWVKLIFLNIPVQLILTIIASFGLTQGTPPPLAPIQIRTPRVRKWNKTGNAPLAH